MNSKALMGIAMVMIGCCSNVVFLEYLITSFPGSGNVITFFQFLFISAEGFMFSVDFGRKKRVIPMMEYVKMVSLFWVVQVVNNYALNFNISMPLHMIFRAGSLMANLVLGIIILKKSYGLSKYISVLMITCGISVCTIVSSTDVRPVSEQSEAGEASYEDFVRWLIGIGMLLFALFMSALMGIFQETIYKNYGKHPNEALFYNHTLPLPIFLFLTSDILNQINLFNSSAPVGVLGTGIPIMWLYLLGNSITQFICIKGVFILTTECASLTVTLVVTLRKFVSLIFSILYFGNKFTFYHWIGTVMVFGGTLLFTETFSRIRNAILPPKKKEN